MTLNGALALTGDVRLTASPPTDSELRPGPATGCLAEGSASTYSDRNSV